MIKADDETGSARASEAGVAFAATPLGESQTRLASGSLKNVRVGNFLRIPDRNHGPQPLPSLRSWEPDLSSGRKRGPNFLDSQGLVRISYPEAVARAW